MIHFIRRRKRFFSIFFTLLMINQFLAPSVAHALTGGPSQPEVQSFQPASTSEMVDLFTGDFSYNIPLFELPGPNGGYPFNLSYQAGVGMDQEASWVGLGWNLNPGAITRQMRGLPDEFKGDVVKTKMSIDPSVTVGLGGGVSVELFGGDATLGVGFNVRNNNYKGFGYSIDTNIGFGGTVGGGMTGGIGLNVSLDSKEGANVSPSLTLNSMTIGADYNSKQGLQSVSLTQSLPTEKVPTGDGKHTWSSGVSATHTLSIARPSYTPQVTMATKNINISATVKFGAVWWGIFGSPYVRGFYSEQWLKDDNKFVNAPAFGYLNSQYASDKSALMDVNREKDGMVSKESPNLAIPSMTYDIYSASGQGISAMYRPMRNDYGILRDPETVSTSTSGSAGADVGPTLTHIGANLTVNHSKSVSGGWSGDHALFSTTGFTEAAADSKFEPWYFKVHGEPDTDQEETANALGGDDAVRVQLGRSSFDPEATATLENIAGPRPAPSKSTIQNQERKPRNQMIQAITKEQLIGGGSEELLSYFKVKYIDHQNVERDFDRTSQKDNHIAGFTALTAEGLRYNYGIPAYNLKQEETSFTVIKQNQQVSRVNVGVTGNTGDAMHNYSGTEQFLKTVEIPEYAHSHLLTSILGPDYVDVDGNGVSEKDLGYWVKFTYKKVTSDGAPYKWRDPYSQAHLQEGYKTDPRDDKGSYSYGEKEIWFLARAETKSHTATFEIENRDDGKGVLYRLQDTNEKGASLHRLKEIKLFSKLSPSIPIKVTKFTYDYSLCKGVNNNGTANGGKLTLKELRFEYGNSSRGALNPYRFSYMENDLAHNPNYDMLAYDRWGNYKPYPLNEFDHNRDFPYVDQDPSKKTEIDRNAAVWSLKEIRLPSGGSVTIDYESDDYAYVQHLQAMQMTQIVPSNGSPTLTTFSLSDPGSGSANDPNLKVRFKLESPIPGTLTSSAQRAEVLKYVDQNRKQLLFKYRINLRSHEEDFFEDLTGYVDINFDTDMGLDNGGSGDYKYGYFYVVREANDRNPFSLRAWQHLRTNQPDLANSAKMIRTTDNAERVKQIRSLGSVGTQLRQMFGGFYNFCSDMRWGREVDINKSWVRLKSPDKIKFGGGLRVKQITMKDAWTDAESVYGQYYEYTTEDENGNLISSGVAAYEPIIGGEENPLRYAKKYVQAVPLRSPNNLFFEYPVNESYFPGAQVGYSKVTVMSLAAANLKGKTTTLVNGSRVFPEGVPFGTSGMTVHEFYTAREFPVITDETNKDNKPYKLMVPIPLLGSITFSKLGATQGYSIVTNDMHGKQKKVSNYRQDAQGNIEVKPISWVKYNYFQESDIVDKQNVFKLKNSFVNLHDGMLGVLPSTGSINAQDRVTIGQETEFFYDMREFKDDTWGGGATYNTDVVILPIGFITVPIPIPTIWPSISKSTVQLRTAVTNKVIFKAGILESTEAFDGGSLIKTENLKWDKQTGAVVLTKVNNNFDAPIYSHTIPAFTQYQGMGAAYKNIGLTLSISNVAQTKFKETLYTFSSGAADALCPGDEMLLFENDPTVTRPIGKVIYNGEEGGNMILYSAVGLTATEYRVMIIRSGFRNQLTVSAGTITALSDPSLQGQATSYSKTIQVPR